jgi:hypothetical protein
MLILLRTVFSFITLLPSPRSYSPIESISFLCLPPLSSSDDASTPSASISITPPLPPATPPPPPPHSFSKPPITHVFSRRPKNPPTNFPLVVPPWPVMMSPLMILIILLMSHLLFLMSYRLVHGIIFEIGPLFVLQKIWFSSYECYC